MAPATPTVGSRRRHCDEDGGEGHEQDGASQGEASQGFASQGGASQSGASPRFRASTPQSVRLSDNPSPCGPCGPQAGECQEDRTQGDGSQGIRSQGIGSQGNGLQGNGSQGPDGRPSKRRRVQQILNDEDTISSLVESMAKAVGRVLRRGLEDGDGDDVDQALLTLRSCAKGQLQATVPSLVRHMHRITGNLRNDGDGGNGEPQAEEHLFPGLEPYQVIAVPTTVQGPDGRPREDWKLTYAGGAAMFALLRKYSAMDVSQLMDEGTEMDRAEILKCLRALWARWMYEPPAGACHVDVARKQTYMGYDGTGLSSIEMNQRCALEVMNLFYCARSQGLVSVFYQGRRNQGDQIDDDHDADDDEFSVGEDNEMLAQQRAMDERMHAMLAKIHYTLAMLEQHSLAQQLDGGEALYDGKRSQPSLLTLSLLRPFGTVLGRDQPVELSSFQQIFLFMLDVTQRFNYRRHGDNYYAEQRTPEDHHTRHFKEEGKISDLLSRHLESQKEIQTNLWMKLTQGGTGLREQVIKALSVMGDHQFPQLEVDRNKVSYRNGIFDANTLTFYEYGQLDALPENTCTSKYFEDNTFNPHTLGPLWFFVADRQGYGKLKALANVHFLPPFFSHDDDDQGDLENSDEEERQEREQITQHNDEAAEEVRGLLKDLAEFVCDEFDTKTIKSVLKFERWNRIKTEALDQIPKTQKWAPQVTRDLYRMLGRMLYETGLHDDWQVASYMFGQAGTGKTILGDTIEAFFMPERVFRLQNDLQSNFGMERAIGTHVAIGMELKGKMQLPITVLQSLISGETIAINRKNEKNMQYKMEIPVMIGGNCIIEGGDAEALARRLMLFRFSRVPKTVDPNIQKNINHAIHMLHVKIARAYLECVYDIHDKPMVLQLFSRILDVSGSTARVNAQRIDEMTTKDLMALVEGLRGRTGLLVDTHMMGGSRNDPATRARCTQTVEALRRRLRPERDVWDVMSKQFLKNRMFLVGLLDPLCRCITEVLEPGDANDTVSFDQLTNLWSQYIEQNNLGAQRTSTIDFDRIHGFVRYICGSVDMENRTIRGVRECRVPSA